ncbi:metal-dependent hydrolase [Membranihabitans marinus]|uniref:metal-dependent hydrolase n=1 Tax=Membranihabitans marinus TaxID=1227546 RepID=UPI001F412E48|nr:metal-dependent hydrolase [Membranihabitans marinus]
MNISYLGHSCFVFKIKGKVILVDPFITHNPLAKEISVDEIPADYIILTHGHSDHLADAESILKRTNAQIISSYEILEWYKKKGFTGHGMNIGGSYNFEFGSLRIVTAIHSSILPDGSYGGHPFGVVIQGENKSFYIAGDTALTMDMKLIPMICKPLDFAILPIGDYFTMGYRDAAIAAKFIECKKIIGCHYDTFEPIKIDKEDVSEYFTAQDLQIFLPEVGETIDI